jgi:hypothetical protein
MHTISPARATSSEISLTLSEQGRLQECEAIITDGLDTFVKVGNALMEIRDSKLYRQTHKTFEDYCRERWGIERRHAYRLIDSAAVVSNLCPIGHIPKSESQCRPLVGLEPEKQKEVWKAACEISGGKPTAKDVEEAKETILEPARVKTADEEIAEASTKALPKYRPCNGLDYATMAIIQLEKIQPNDTQRDEAFDKVIGWIKTQRPGHQEIDTTKKMVTPNWLSKPNNRNLYGYLVSEKKPKLTRILDAVLEFIATRPVGDKCQLSATMPIKRAAIIQWIERNLPTQ